MSTLVYSALALSGSTLLTILSLVGLASWSRQIVRVVPSNPALLALRSGRQRLVETKRDGQVARDANALAEADTDDGSGKMSVSKWVGKNVPSLKGTFKPSWWLPNGHLQTIFSVIGNFTTVDHVTYRRTYLRLPDGGTLGLDFTPHDRDLPDDAPLVVVCHGLTGGSYESYVRNVLARVIKPESEGGLGGRAVVINFRGCAGVPLTSPQLYSAGTTHDLSLALHYLRTIYPSSPLHGIGFSLGASVLARYLGETGDSSLLSSGVSLGAPWNLPGMSIKLEQHWFTRMVYSRAMAGNLVRLFFRHYDPRPETFEGGAKGKGEREGERREREEREMLFARDGVAEMKRMRKRRGLILRDVDEVMTSKLGGPASEGEFPFKGAKEYYEWASPYKLLHNVKRPLLAINAFDDPIIDGSYLPIPEVQASSYVFLAVTGAGGHLGWFDGPLFGSQSKSRWISKPAIEWLRAASRDLPAVGKVEVERGQESVTPSPCPTPRRGDGPGVTGSAGDTRGPGEEGKEDGWVWVKRGGHAIQGGGRRGWRVLKAHEVIHGGEGDGVLQGL